MSIFLTSIEMTELTGYQTRSKQVSWLSCRGWQYEVSATGKVNVLRRYAEMRMGLPVDGNVPKPTEPDFSSL